MKQLFIDSLSVEAVATPNMDSFNFLNKTGRKKFHSQGFYGQDVIVSVIDTGVNKHPEFEDRLLAGTYFVSSGLCDKDSSDNHVVGHGTHVSGTIAGKNCGIAPKTKILPVKVFDGMGDGMVEDIIKACEYSLKYRDSRGKRVDIVNMSLACGLDYLQSIPGLYAKFETAVNNLVAAGIAVIVASGNTGTETILLPACFKEVVTVGAVDVNRQVALFSTSSKEVDLCQNGVDVISASSDGVGYRVLSGTSMASPHVAGIAALLISKYKAQNGGAYMPEPLLFEMLRMNSVDIDVAGIDMKTGVGFCTLNPTMGTTRVAVQDGNLTVMVNGKPVQSQVAPRAVPPGVFIGPYRIVVEAAGGTAAWNQETKTATFEFEV